MDQQTRRLVFDPVEHETLPKRTAIKRFVLLALVAIAVIGGAGFGFRMGRSEHTLPDWVPAKVAALLHAAPTQEAAHPTTGPIVYYRDPDGKPFYAAEPKTTDDGRAYVSVHASEDITFDDVSIEASANTSAAHSGKHILYYRNPMGLPDTSPVPKKDSMGMDYVPVYEGESADDTTITLSPAKVQRTGVRSEVVTRRVIVRQIRVPGTIQLDERRVTVVSTRSDAFVDRVENVTVGDFVRRNQPLVKIYSPEINSAAAQFIANPGYEGARRRLENLNVPEDVISEMERTHNVPMAITWTSPRDGIVLERGAIEGMKAPAGLVLFRIADISHMWLVADVPEFELGNVHVGQSVTVRVRFLPGRTFTGRVDVIYPQLNKETRTARVRIELPNPDNALLADMYADVEIASGSPAPVVAVPDSAVIDSGTRQVVILDKGDGRFEPREVTLGVRGEGFVEIRKGVTESDRVVIAANFLIDAESNLKAALRGMTNPEGAQ
ncbi:MAG: efflux RND transporter periplasmic adaptor subunit [Rhizobiales bacterium]|nr:efflux RND transporter periplasmic adaptor subunit [Hyphomicrobiales bacterium]